MLFRFNDAGDSSTDVEFSANAQTPTDSPKRDPDFATISSVHFVGIGGSGLSVLAHVALEQGLTVSGSDIADGPRSKSVRKAGATVFIGHSADNLGEGKPSGLGPGTEQKTVLSHNGSASKPPLRNTPIAPSGASNKTGISRLLQNVQNV